MTFPTLVAPPTLVRAPVRAPFGFGLFSLLDLRLGSEDRWENGVTWEARSCGEVRGLGAQACPPGETPQVGVPLPLPTFERGHVLEEAVPFTVYGEVACSPLGLSPEQAQEEATARLVAGEQRRVEQALWTGDLGNRPTLLGPQLADGPVLDDLGSVGDLAEALAVLEDYASVVLGSQAWLHTSRGTASLLVKRAHARVERGRLLAPLGTPIVAGSGYPAGTGEIVLTAPMLGYASEAFTSTEVRGDLLDRRQNELFGVAFRTYVLGLDSCALAKITSEDAIVVPAPPPGSGEGEGGESEGEEG